MRKEKNILLMFVLIYSFILPAFILNCEGVVIMNLIKEQYATMSAASWLQGCKDLTIMISSFVLISIISKMGYKKALFAATLIQMIICILMGSFVTLNSSRVYFILAGLSFAVVKITIYSSVGTFTKNQSQHAGLLSILEGVYMLGILSGFWIFSFFMSFTDSWSNTFWFLAVLCLIGLILISITPFKDISSEHEIVEDDGLKKGIRGYIDLIIKPVFILFIILTFMYVFVEQSLTTWLPTYNNIVLSISEVLSVQVVSVFLLGLAVGRIFSAFVMKYIHWKVVLISCIIMAICSFTSSIVMAYIYVADTAITTWSQLPLVAFLIPLTGFFIGPVYPTICSTILTSHPKKMHVKISGLIIVFSALGGTIGARIIGGAFENIGGINAMKIPIIPLVVLLLLVVPYEIIMTKYKKLQS